MNRPQRRKYTKIVATIAANAADRAFIADLRSRGMDVVRLNTAHMAPEELEGIVADVRAVSPQLAVMVDTKGPNIRTCGIEADIALKKGATVRISGRPGPDRIAVNYEPFADEVPVGSRIVCDDGAAAFRVTGREDGCLVAEALFDCVVRNRKSINVPDVSLKAPALTDRDREFLAEAVRLGVDFIAHSFVRSAADIHEVRKALGEGGADIGIIAKIENREGVNNVGEILAAADGVMVARGDLGIEIPLEEVPAIQKQIIHAARMQAKPVITAMQMLQSMEDSPVPTRAEVSDVANAVYDGTDAVMLSGETAHGRFPREAVEMMNRIVLQAEAAPMQFFTRLRDVPEVRKETAYILAAAMRSVDFLPVRAILCSTLSGVSARACSAVRERVPVYALTPRASVMRRLALSYGVFPLLSELDSSREGQLARMTQCLRDECADLGGGDLVMMLAKHSDKASRNNLCCLATVDELLGN